jgi:hypothetical protein
MSEDKIPLCDRHHFRMRSKGSSFLPTAIFNCASPGCGRYYGKRYGYFNLLPEMPPSLKQTDPTNRSMKLCTIKGQAHPYMAITRPKNTAPGARDLWCWYCYECDKSR